jgi:hypothetical protein
MESDVKIYLQELVFSHFEGLNYTIDAFDINERKVDHLAEYLDRYGD